MSSKEYDFRWRLDVPEDLRRGAVFDRWEEEASISICETGVLRVGDDGFYIQFLVDGKDAQVYDLVQISEARPGVLPKVRFFKIGSLLSSGIHCKEYSV